MHCACKLHNYQIRLLPMNLQDLYPTLTGEQRVALATAAGIGKEYLRQLAYHHATLPTIKVLYKLSKAHPKLSYGQLVAEFTPWDADDAPRQDSLRVNAPTAPAAPAG